jgi:hypothetical protein
VTAPVVRELRVTDIRCHAEGCGAGPGQRCRFESRPNLEVADEQPSKLRIVAAHTSRYVEYRELVAAGWEWQEVQP